jgi:UDP-glucose-4-epimerase GalE
MTGVLVTGGAGFIGSHLVLRLAEAGIPFVVLDDLSNGHRDAVAGFPLVEGDMRTPGLLDRVFAEHPVDAVIHLAGCIDAGQSVWEPARHHENNLGSTIRLLDAMVRHGVRRLVFSSSASVYAPGPGLLAENAPTEPTTPYGVSKLRAEEAIADRCRTHGLSAMALRYFNAAGADPRGRAGERHRRETHLIPLAIDAALGRRPALEVFGTDYPTPDGTCLRDYVHVDDLARAHLAALRWSEDAPGRFLPVNLGVGKGFSVLDVLRTVEAVSGRTVPFAPGPRRSGDAPSLLADPAAASSVLGWTPAYRDLTSMVEHAWKFRSGPDPSRYRESHPGGDARHLPVRNGGWDDGGWP